MIGVNPEITSFESMEVVITVGSITIRLSVIYRMPPVKSKNGLKRGTFYNEFNDYLENLSCMNDNIVIVGDFNIDWLNTDGSERKQFCNILETFGFVQNMCTETHRSHHLLDYIITRKECNIISDFLVGGVRCCRLWFTSQLLRPSGQQCSHSGRVCPQIQG